MGERWTRDWQLLRNAMENTNLYSLQEATFPPMFSGARFTGTAVPVGDDVTGSLSVVYR